MAYLNLNVKSAYSLLSSTITIDALIQHAKNYNLNTLSLVEDRRMHSAIKFYTRAKNAGIKPIIGVALPITIGDQIHQFTLFAIDETGYQALLKLTSDYHLNGNVLIEDVLLHAAQLVICMDVNLFQNLSFEQPPHFYLGLSQKKDLDIARNLTHLELPFIYLPAVRLLEAEDLASLKVLQAIKDNKKVNDIKINRDVHFLSRQEMADLTEEDPILKQALENTVVVANLCEVELNLSQTLLPKSPLQDDVKGEDYLRALCLKGLEKRYGTEAGYHLERLYYELDVITKMGYSDYFLIVWDFVKYAKNKGILVGPGRGSAAGSLVAYVLGVTDVDPIKYGLLFERFLNPERLGLPDIDIDFQDDRRDEVIHYVADKYGSDVVCHIGTFGTFASRSAWRDTARVHGQQTAQINSVTKFLSSGSTLKENLKNSDGLSRLLQRNTTLKRIYELAMKVEGLPRNTSTHAAGVIIAPDNLRQYTALQKGSDDQVYLSQYEASDLEQAGLLKMDFLGLRNLTMIKEISALVQAHVKPDFNIKDIPLDDGKTYDLIAKAKTTGVFQLESTGMKAALRQVKPSNIEDIISVLALFRPGPMAHIPLFAARKEGKEKIVYDHPDLIPVLKPTYGIIVYQEQIMEIARIVGGYRYGEADILRRAISKKDARILAEEGEKFVSRATGRGYPRDVAMKVYQLIEKFANYGFNRAHAASYAFVSYQMAYLKAHFPQYFMLSVLTTELGSASGVARVIKEARELGLKTVAPCLNESDLKFTAEEKVIRLGFLSIKGIGRETAQKLMDEREKGRFESFYDFIARCYDLLGEKTIQTLIDSGTCDTFGHDRELMKHNIKAVIEHTKLGMIVKNEFEMDEIGVPEAPSTEEAMAIEQALFGFYLNTHPIQTFLSVIDEKGWKLPHQANEISEGGFASWVGFVSNIRTIKDKNKNTMAFMTISDEADELDVTIFSRDYRPEYRELRGQVVVIEASKQMRNDKIGLNFRKLIGVLNQGK